MTYDVLAVRSAEAEDMRLYPVLGDQMSLVEYELDDGRQVARVMAKSITVNLLDGNSLRRILRFENVKAEVSVTDARVIVACDKFTKGGGWIGFGVGGLAAAAAANAVSSARAAHRRKGKVLVGHVRHPWLRTVGCKAKQGWGSDESVRLGLKDGQKRTLFLDLDLPKDTDAAAVAQMIACRAAYYHLAYDLAGMTAPTQAAYRELSHAARLDPQPTKFTTYTMPTYRYAMAATAFPKSVTARA